jgi:hypothetical protein
MQLQHTSNLDPITAVSIRGAVTGAKSARSLRHDVHLVMADNGLPSRMVTG